MVTSWSPSVSGICWPQSFCLFPELYRPCSLMCSPENSKHGVSTFRSKLLVRAREEFGYVHLGTVTVQDDAMFLMCQNSMDPWILNLNLLFWVFIKMHLIWYGDLTFFKFNGVFYLDPFRDFYKWHVGLHKYSWLRPYQCYRNSVRCQVALI